MTEELKCRNEQEITKAKLLLLTEVINRVQLAVNKGHTYYLPSIIATPKTLFQWQM